jgi:hypothetical protein
LLRNFKALESCSVTRPLLRCTQLMFFKS